MKTLAISQVLLLCTAGLMSLPNGSPLGSNTAIALSSPMVAAAVDQTMAPRAMDTVIIKGMAFSPSELRVHKGDTVVWINEDIVAHNVTISLEINGPLAPWQRGVPGKKR